jgi:glycine/D-amino acid oxidase-like deaminating enzyme/nitrite reductase/ring-hydroxylating ferredoxin subunit
MDFSPATSGNNNTLWLKNFDRPYFPSLSQNLTTDVCIVGGGIIGLTIAYRLVSEGKSVVLIEDGKLCSGETGRTSAHLTNVLDDRFYELERVYGEKDARLAALSHVAAINYIEQIILDENIECEFLRVDGYLFPDQESAQNILQKELAATKRLGLTAEMLNKNPDNSFDMTSCLKFPNQAQFHPVKYLTKLAEIIVKKGGKIYENTHATKFENGMPVHVFTNNDFIITANHLVVATNVPVNDRVVIHTKQEPKRTYIIGSLIPKGSLLSALYWDTATPYRYVRVHQGNYRFNNTECDMLITGGEDHRTGVPPKSYEDCFHQVETWTKKHFPQILNQEIRWSGQVIEPVDYLAFIGHNPLDSDNVYIATGDSGNGLTHGTIAGILISDLILDRNNDWEHIYKPSRKSLKTLHNYIRHNLNALLSYVNYFKSGKMSDVDKIEPGQGAVLRRGLSRIAVYRDDDGNLHECSAICPHMQSIVTWNSAEKTWDCPAHGSRFSGEGVVINGPAINGMKKLTN